MERVNGRRRSGLCCKKSLKALAWIIYCFLPLPTVSRRHGRGFQFLKYRMQRLSNEKKGTRRLLEPIGGRDSKAWRCDVNLTKKTNKQQNYKDLLEEFQSKCTVCSPARLFQGWGKLSFRLTYTTPERHFEPTETQLRGNRR